MTEGLDDLRREAILSLTSLFVAGEEAVTLDLPPLVLAIASFGLEQSTFADYASAQFGKRYGRISRARGQSLDEIDALADEELARAGS